MGWNFLIKNAECRMLNDFLNGLDRSYFYFVHSYHAVPEDKNLIAATTDYGETLTAAIAYENIFATQFHPEKSGDVGLKLLKNFCDWKA